MRGGGRKSTMPGEFSVYKDVIVPLLAAFAGGVFALLSGLLVATRSERFRKLALWEPYAKALWDQQVAICCETLNAANKAVTGAMNCFEVVSPDKGLRTQAFNFLSKHLLILQDLAGRQLAVCTSKFNQSVTSLTSQLLVIFHRADAGEELKPELLSNLNKLWTTLVDDARTELRVERLDAQARAALEEATRRAPPSDPTGNLTLPY